MDEIKSLGNYTEANNQMNKFASLAPNDVRAKEFKGNQNYKTTLDNSKITDIKFIKTTEDLAATFK